MKLPTVHVETEQIYSLNGRPDLPEKGFREFIDIKGLTPRTKDLEMSEEASVRFPGERLTVDGDYATWRFVAEAYFLAQGVYDLILGVDVAFRDVPETGTTQNSGLHAIPGANETSERWSIAEWITSKYFL